MLESMWTFYFYFICKLRVSSSLPFPSFLVVKYENQNRVLSQHDTRAGTLKKNFSFPSALITEGSNHFSLQIHEKALL